MLVVYRAIRFACYIARPIEQRAFLPGGGYQREIVSLVSGSRNLQLVSDHGMGVAYCLLWRIPTREILSSALSRRHARTRARYRTPPHASGLSWLLLLPLSFLLHFFPPFFSPFSYRHRALPFRRSLPGDHRQWRNFKEKSKSIGDRPGKLFYDNAFSRLD